MKTTAIRQRLHQFIETAEEKKVKAIYTLFENEIIQDEWEYSDKFKAELDRRYKYYKNGGKMVSASQSARRVRELLGKGGKKGVMVMFMTLLSNRNMKKE